MTIKRIVSVSLGSSRRNHRVQLDLLGESFLIERLGTDGDIDKAIAMFRELDGKVDAFGMGGIDLYIVAGKRRYMLRDAKRIAQAVSITPLVDGSGLKNTLERRAVNYLSEEGICNLAGTNVLLVCGVDRFGMAEALTQQGAKTTFGDLIYGLDLPIAINSLQSLERVARILGPLVSRLPFKMLYPTGAKQEVIIAKHRKYYEENEIIAGDFHFIKKYLPSSLKGKIILTNTVTAEDVELLASRGVKTLITTTPEFQGRSFGTNVIEALLVALLGKRHQDITPDDYNLILDQVGFKPRVIQLVGEEQANLR